MTKAHLYPLKGFRSRKLRQAKQIKDNSCLLLVIIMDFTLTSALIGRCCYYLRVSTNQLLVFVLSFCMCSKATISTEKISKKKKQQRLPDKS